MEIWCDSADIQAIEPFVKLGFIHGVTTNPKILSLQPIPASTQIQSLLDIQSGPLAVQVTAVNEKPMLEQAKKFHELNARIVVKIPMTEVGIIVLPKLFALNIPTLATGVFSAEQFLLSAKLGAQYVAPYLFQMAQHDIDVHHELSTMQKIRDHFNFSTKIMAASIQDFKEIKKIASLGISAITLTPGCLKAWTQTHPLTHQGTQGLLNAWHPFVKQYPENLFQEETP